MTTSHTGPGTYVLTFEELRRYQVRVKAPTRIAAEEWADNQDDIFQRVASHRLGKLLRDDLQFDCQEVCLSLAAEADDIDIEVDEKGEEIGAKHG